jgi:hypothetical protein
MTGVLHTLTESRGGFLCDADQGLYTTGEPTCPACLKILRKRAGKV